MDIPVFTLGKDGTNAPIWDPELPSHRVYEKNDVLHFQGSGRALITLQFEQGSPFRATATGTTQVYAQTDSTPITEPIIVLRGRFPFRCFLDGQELKGDEINVGP